MFTIDIQAQVDGQLQQVMFAEGQHVKKGDELAKIDPRPFQAALDQAKAKRAQDAATLIAAEKDLARSKSLSLKSFETQQNVDQQQAKVDQLKAAIATDEAAIESAQTQLDKRFPSTSRVTTGRTSETVTAALRGPQASRWASSELNSRLRLCSVDLRV